MQLTITNAHHIRNGIKMKDNLPIKEFEYREITFNLGESGTLNITFSTVGNLKK